MHGFGLEDSKREFDGVVSEGVEVGRSVSLVCRTKESKRGRGVGQVIV